MSNTKKLLQERGSTHGDFTDNARISQELKAIVCTTDNWNFKFTDVEKEAMEMILHKIARISCGNPHFIDAWKDLSGYSMLVVDRLKETPGALDVKQEYITVAKE